MSGINRTVYRTEAIVPEAPDEVRESILVYLTSGDVLEAWRQVRPSAVWHNYGGVETHYRSCPKYMTPSDFNKVCTATGEGCYHDGSGLAFSDLGLDDLFERKQYKRIAGLVADRYGVSA